jgi:hypothetical protein
LEEVVAIDVIDRVLIDDPLAVIPKRFAPDTGLTDVVDMGATVVAGTEPFKLPADPNKLDSCCC